MSTVVSGYTHTGQPEFPTVPMPRKLVGRSIYENRSAGLCAFSRDPASGFFTGEPWWIEYIALHRVARGRIEAGDPVFGKILVYSCTDKEACNGLGTEFKGIASAQYMSTVLGIAG